jgi:hypothetical protein
LYVWQPRCALRARRLRSDRLICCAGHGRTSPARTMPEPFCGTGSSSGSTRASATRSMATARRDGCPVARRGVHHGDHQLGMLLREVRAEGFVDLVTRKLQTAQWLWHRSPCERWRTAPAITTKRERPGCAAPGQTNAATSYRVLGEGPQAVGVAAVNSPT